MLSRKKVKKSAIQTLVGVNTRVHGNIEFDGGFHVAGYVRGNVEATKDENSILSISEQGCVEGSVVAPYVVVNGTIKGDVLATKRVELGAKARVIGNVQYNLIEMVIGAEVNGKLIHENESGSGLKPEQPKIAPVSAVNIYGEK